MLVGIFPQTPDSGHSPSRRSQSHSLLGFGVRLFALLAVAFSIHLWLGLYLQQQEWPWNYVFLAIIHTLFVAYAAGRSLGLDALLRRHANPTSPVGIVS